MTARPGGPRDEPFQERALQHLAELDTIYAVAPLALASMSPELRFVRVNERFAQLHGKHVADHIGKSLPELLPDRASAAEAAARRIIETGDPLHGVDIVCSPAMGPEHLWTESWFAQRTDEGKVVGIEIVAADLSGHPRAANTLVDNDVLRRLIAKRTRKLVEANERLRTEMKERSIAENERWQAQKMEAVGQLTGGIAHDFNNLLTVIGGNLELIEHRIAPNDPVRRLTAAAQEAAGRGKRLIEHLLAFSRRQRLHPKMINVLDVVRDFQDLLKRAAGEAIKVEFAIEPTLWPCHVDLAQLEAAFLNLTLNARDAMPQGGTLRFAARNITIDDTRRDLPELLPGPYVLIAVSDTGRGMERRIVERAFEPFFTTKQFGQGTGLGLSMVYGFAKQSSGHAAIRSLPGAGTTIEIYLPKASRAAEPALRAGDTGEDTPTGSALVLVVEDDENVLETVSEMLAELGYRTLGATSGREALTMLRRRPEIGLVLTDVVMPGGMSGIELAREARRLRDGIKVLLTSGYAQDVLEPSAARAEFPLIGKPLRQGPLARALHMLQNET